MSIKGSIISYIYTLLTADATLKGLMGGTVRLYNDVAPKDAEFDYLVHELRLSPNEHQALKNGTYTIDIWSSESNPSTIWDIENRIITLLDWLNFSASNPTSGVTDSQAVRVWLDTDIPVPEDEENIWHRALSFSVRFDRFREVVNILNR